MNFNKTFKPFFTALVLSIMLVYFGCKKESGPTGTGSTGGSYGSGTISATVGTQNFSFSGTGVWMPQAGPSTVAVFDTCARTLTIIGYQQVSGSFYNFLLVQIYFGFGGVRTGTFVIDTTLVNYFIAGVNIDTSRVDSLGYFSFTGSINVSSVSNTNVVGTFAGTAVRISDFQNVSVSNGAFNVQYTNGTNPIGGGNNISCGSTASFTLNGDGFNNQTFTLNQGYGDYSTVDSATFIYVRNPATSDILSIAFEGSNTGTFSFGTDNLIIVIRSVGPQRALYPNHSGNIVVTSYGDVGGYIGGTFAGKLYDSTGVALDSVTVTNGSFNVGRIH